MAASFGRCIVRFDEAVISHKKNVGYIHAWGSVGAKSPKQQLKLLDPLSCVRGWRAL